MESSLCRFIFCCGHKPKKNTEESKITPIKYIHLKKITKKKGKNNIIYVKSTDPSIL